MGAVIAGLGLVKPVIVSPSMSGSFSLPYLFTEPLATIQERISGFVPVAPVHTSDFDVKKYEQLKVFTRRV